jgi:hypothetical protein
MAIMSAGARKRVTRVPVRRAVVIAPSNPFPLLIASSSSLSRAGPRAFFEGKNRATVTDNGRAWHA